MYREWNDASEACGRNRYDKSICKSCNKKTDGVINRTFVQIMEVLCYDIELTYVKRVNKA